MPSTSPSPGPYGAVHDRDGQFRQLQLYLDKGLHALLRVAAHLVARNRRGAGDDLAPLDAYAPLPTGGVPGCFDASFCGLPYRDGSLISGGHPAYGRHIDAIAEATVKSWNSVRS
ncbi:MAG: hypothetical protein HOV97_01335 [Nonomuraea sp.]|nr:hypothetical protein [Nonomuraea sp.]